MAGQQDCDALVEVELEDEEEDWSRPQDHDDMLPHSILTETQGGSPLSKRSKKSGLRSPRHLSQIGHDSSLLHGDLGHNRTIIHIDVDCFYAQVEMIRNPELRNKPVGIQQKYIIVTCNYEARKFGVNKLMLVKDAKQKCPSLVLVNGEDLTHYREMSYKITEALTKYVSVVERLGFDENFLDVTELVHSKPSEKQCKVEGFTYGMGGDAEEQQSAICSCGCHRRLTIGSHIAADIRQCLREELGITCCAGIGHNKLLAKLAGSTHKPNLQTTIFPEQAEALIASLEKVRKIPGIGSKTSQRLASLGVNSIQDLRSIPLEDLVPEFGRETADILKKLCYGIDHSTIVCSGKPQSMSDEDSFKKCSDIKDASRRIEELLESLLRRLQSDGRIPQTFRLSVRRVSEVNRYNNRESRQCQIPSNVFLSNSLENLDTIKEKLFQVALDLFKKMVDVSKPFHLTLFNVGFSKLEEKKTKQNAINSYFGPTKVTTVPEVHSPNSSSKTASKPRQSSGVSKWLEVSNSRFASVPSASNTLASCGNNPPGRTEDTVSKPCAMRTKLSSNSVKRKQSNFLSFDQSTRENEGKKRCASLIMGGLKAGQKQSRIPNGVDPDVFASLPPAIQQEVLADYPKDLSNTGNNCADNKWKYSDPATKRPATTSIQDTTCTSRLQSPSITDNSKRVAIEKQLVSGQTIAKTVCQKVISDPGELPNIPTDLDPEVFRALPADIQQELARECQQKSSGIQCPQNRTKMKMSKVESQGIMRFFKKS